MNKLKTIKKRLIVLAAVLLAVITLGITYAFFSYTRAGTTENTIKSGSITFLYDELNQEGNSIAITDAMPMTDTEGKAQENYFDFKIVSTVSSANSIPYDITLRQKDGTDNIGNIVKVYLSKITAYNAAVNLENQVELSTFSNLSNVTHNGYTEKQLHRDIVPAGSSSYTQYYRLKMWIDNDAPLTNDTMNKTFTVMVNVYANGHVLDANSSAATVNSVSVGGNALSVVSTSNGIDTYKANLPEGTTQTTIVIDAGDYTQVTITKTQSDYETPIVANNNITRLSQTVARTVALTNGNNYYKIIARSEDGTDSKEIHVIIGVGETFGMRIMRFNPTVLTNPTLNTTSEAAGENGFYSMDVTDGYGGTDGTTYFFRGNVTNNYVSFANKTWRIVRINEDGTVRIILDDAINENGYIFNSAFRDLNSSYYVNSPIKTETELWYANNITGDDALKVASGDYFCEQFKVLSNPEIYRCDGVDLMYYDYIPDLKCGTDGYGYGILPNMPSVGLISYDELILAGNYFDIAITNYYLYKPYFWWTMSPAGFHNVGALVFNVMGNDSRYPFGTIGNPHVGRNDIMGRLRPVINLKADVTATGTGTEQDPYVIQ